MQNHSLGLFWWSVHPGANQGLIKAPSTLTTSLAFSARRHWPLRAQRCVLGVCVGRAGGVLLPWTDYGQTRLCLLSWDFASLWRSALFPRNLRRLPCPAPQSQGRQPTPDNLACRPPPQPLPSPQPSPCTSLLAGDSGVLAFRTATGGGRGLLARVAITWPWAFNNSWGVTAWTCRLGAGAGAATLAEFTTHGKAPITWEKTTQGPRGVRPVPSPAPNPKPRTGRRRDLTNHFTLLDLSKEDLSSRSCRLYSTSRAVAGQEEVHP